MEEMKKIIKENIPVVRSVVSKEEAKKLMTERKEIYKVEHIDDLGTLARAQFAKN